MSSAAAADPRSADAHGDADPVLRLLQGSGLGRGRSGPGRTGTGSREPGTHGLGVGPRRLEPGALGSAEAPGRDELLAAWLTLPTDRSRAVRTLRAWADRPIAERTAPGVDGAAPEVGIALFVMLVAELRRSGAPWRDVGPLIPHADRSLELILRHGDRDHDGLVECRSTGVAVAEVQGYVYGAFRARARLALELAEGEPAGCWHDAADGLRFRFHDAFWDARTRTFAPALDAHKQRLEGSGIGIAHCLWTGIVEPDKAEAAAAQLRATGPSRGAVDDAVLAAGLMRYGLVPPE